MKLSVRDKTAKVKSDKPAFKGKEKSPSGGKDIYRYDEPHIKARWKEKKEKMKKLEKNLTKFRKEYEKDLASDDEKTRAIAACVGLIDDTSMRIGNEKSAKEEGTFGATTLKVKHVKVSGGKIKFDFKGKGAIEQHVELKNKKVIKVIKDLMKGKKANDFVFEVDGKKIWDRTVNRYLEPHGISAKDLRGFHSNRMMKEMLKKKDWKDALEEVAEIVGHEPSTLKNQYLDPELVEKYEKKDKKASISQRVTAEIGAQTPTIEKTVEDLFYKPEYGPGAQTKQIEPPLDIQPKPDVERPISISPEMATRLTRNVSNVGGDIANYPDLQKAWQILAPFLPSGARLSSGWRSDNKQAKIILEYWLGAIWSRGKEKWILNEGFFHKKFPGQDTDALRWWLNLVRGAKPITGRLYKYLNRAIEPLRKIMITYVPDGSENEPPVALKIAKMGTSKHLAGRAFDVSGASIWAISRAAHHVNTVFSNFVQFARIMKEQGQQAVHIVVAPGVRVPSEQVLADALKQYPPAKMASISKRAELDKEDMAWVQSIKPISSRTTGAPMMYGAVPHEVVHIDQETRKSLNIGKRTNVSQAVYDAWGTLKPFLPDGSRMASASRSEEDQIRILRHYSRKYLGQDIPEHLRGDLRVRKQISAQLKRDHKIIVLPSAHTKNKYSHGKGNAFDISGADLHQIENAVNMVSRDKRLPVKLRALREDENNAVHVSVISTQHGETAIAQDNSVSISKRALEEDNRHRQIEDIYEDFLNSSPPDNIVQEFKDAFGVKKCATDNLLDEIGFGLEDMPGDWFEESSMFREREDVPEHDIHNVSKAEARKLAKDEPDKFFYRGLHKEYKDLEAEALGNLIQENAKFFFVFGYHEREEDAFQDLIEKAAELLSQQDVRAFFYYHLHHKFPELGRGAIIQLIDTNPDSFFDFGLQKDYPDLDESAGAARNIKDPNKVELEQPEWIKNDPEKSISIRDKNAISQMAEDDDDEKLKEYFKIREQYKQLFDEPRGEEEDLSIEEKRKKFWKHQFDPKEIGTGAHFWEFPKEKEESLWDEKRKKERLKKERKQYWKHQLSPTRWLGHGTIPFWKYPISSRVQEKVISKRAKDKPKAGVFIKLPRDLAKQFPSLGKEHDDSVPHVTALFIGLVLEKHEILLEEIVKRVAMEHNPFELSLDEKVSYFPATKHSDDCKVAKLNIISPELKKLHKALKKAIINAEMDVDDHFPGYKPHTTLEYMEPPKEKYDTDIPSGSWTADKIEIWNGDKKTTISLGRKKKAYLSERINTTGSFLRNRRSNNGK